MAKTKKKTANTKRKRNIFKIITPDDAFEILHTLAKEDANIAKRIEQLAMEYLSDVQVDEVAGNVYSALDALEVEDLWDSSGSTWDGYVDPAERSWEMVEEALEPFWDELEKYQKLSLTTEAKFHCMGILQGIHQFEKESNSEFKDWAVDAPGEYFGTTLEKWRDGCESQEELTEMEEFIQAECPKWAKWYVTQ